MTAWIPHRLGRQAKAPLVAFARARGGASALEFAIVAVPFLFLLLASLELSLIFVANTNLQNATFAAARQIRVGAVLAPGVAATTSNGAQMDMADFKASICKNMILVPNASCLANLYIDVRTLTNFTGTMASSPFTGPTLDTTNFCFYSGASGSIVEFRSYYTWQIFTPVMLSMLVNTTAVTGPQNPQKGKFFVLSSHEVFRNEPSSGGSNTGASC